MEKVWNSDDLLPKKFKSIMKITLLFLILGIHYIDAVGVADTIDKCETNQVDRPVGYFDLTIEVIHINRIFLSGCF